MKYKGTFEFFCTFLEGLTDLVPVTIPYNLAPSKKRTLESHKSLRFVHSGNWWNIKNLERRTKEEILTRQMELANEKTIGLMSKNVQPGDHDLKEEENRLKKLYNKQIDYKKFVYWLLDSSDLIKYFKKNLENANWARENNESNSPIYCSIQVNNYKSARNWFKTASRIGHKYFCIGVSEFLKTPKYKKEGIQRLFEIALGIREVINNKSQLHYSGVASYYLIPILAYLGISSFDGSTPVISALAYGTIFNENGYSKSANTLKGNDKMKEKFFGNTNKCECEVCTGKNINEIVDLFVKDRNSRVIHNLAIWRNLIREINSNRNNLEKFLEKLDQRLNSHYFKFLLKTKDKITKKYKKLNF